MTKNNLGGLTEMDLFLPKGGSGARNTYTNNNRNFDEHFPNSYPAPETVAFPVPPQHIPALGASWVNSQWLLSSPQAEEPKKRNCFFPD